MITENYIMKIVKDYANSPAGKAAIKKKTGLTYTSEDPSAILVAYGETMKQVLFKRINALIKSVTMDDIIVGKPYQNEYGIWSIDISFRDGSMRRDSLDLENYQEGLKNIVLLFAKGYHARNYVYGWWMTSYGNHGSVRSRKDRTGDDFLIKAVDEFNKNYGKDMAMAALVGDYKDCSKT